MMQTNKIAILMATYNGEKFLGEQIDSLFTQTFQDWHLYVHDDGSTDSTVDILKEYEGKYPDRITLMNYPSQGGACNNFLSMLEKVEAKYYMFCDQDDVWMTEKIADAYEAMTELEQLNYSTPIVINTDLIVVDEEKKIMAGSFWNYEKIDPDWVKDYKDHAALQYVTGCTMLFNRKVKDIVKFTNDKVTMHDVWIALSVVANGGIIKNLHKARILYRQHGNNTLGAIDAKELTPIYRLKHIRSRIALNRDYFLEMNAIRKVSLVDYIVAKIRYAVHANGSFSSPPSTERVDEKPVSVL